MVAKTVAVDRAEEIASWLSAAIFLVRFGEERGIVDVATSRLLYKVMRHTKFSTTQRYIHPDSSSMLDAVNKIPTKR